MLSDHSAVLVRCVCAVVQYQVRWHGFGPDRDTLHTAEDECFATDIGRKALQEYSPPRRGSRLLVFVRSLW
jgi:hypothetical protein